MRAWRMCKDRRVSIYDEVCYSTNEIAVIAAAFVASSNRHEVRFGYRGDFRVANSSHEPVLHDLA